MKPFEIASVSTMATWLLCACGSLDHRESTSQDVTPDAAALCAQQSGSEACVNAGCSWSGSACIPSSDDPLDLEKYCRCLNEDACHTDVRCEAIPYWGESLVPCDCDARGFCSNCPSDGCRVAGLNCPTIDALQATCEPTCGWDNFDIDDHGCRTCGCLTDWPPPLPVWCEATGPSCGGISPIGCPDGFFCSFANYEDTDWPGPGYPECRGVYDQLGVCEFVPRECQSGDEFYVPSCGCSSGNATAVTYPNECLRRQAQASFSHRGACQ